MACDTTTAEKKKTLKDPLYIFILSHVIENNHTLCDHSTCSWNNQVFPCKEGLPEANGGVSETRGKKETPHLELSSSVAWLLRLSSGRIRSAAQVLGQKQKSLYGDGGVLRELHEPVWLPTPEPWYWRRKKSKKYPYNINMDEIKLKKLK